jgi:hypothetical protein
VPVSVWIMSTSGGGNVCLTLSDDVSSEDCCVTIAITDFSQRVSRWTVPGESSSISNAMKRGARADDNRAYFRRTAALLAPT